MDIYLIKHGQSTKNTKENNSNRLPDHIVPLTNQGIIECNEAGKFLKEYLENNNISITNAVIWVSPFLRTRNTAQIINGYLNIKDYREDYSLIEQRYGLFSDRTLNRTKMLYQDEFELYENYCQNNGRFYVKMPQGEAPMDVAIRTRQFLSNIKEDNKSPIFIVSHETTIKTIVMNTFNYSPEWFNMEPDSDNCSIKLINKEKNQNEFIYGGKTLQK